MSAPQNREAEATPPSDSYETKNSSSKPTTAFQGKGTVLGSSNNATPNIPGTDTKKESPSKKDTGYHQLGEDAV
eukprot:CAMPEP_0170517438 /NCGR_PEP_ID=MMETSP0209-20121228/3436_1 /TAXON_ID=665100 ORGANISM="Litonotus pictus, Strain P1" /NCGR_SAMPLE_ID=MMETSP0209 /ASSEMBLY_ACC=CAM_ASM_000301 /LENGTH=73 /DNA_ID=CAMNT_0010802689 /DNA_START=765 /DNA_END=986 /DNA_ORIENTATION=-